MHGHDCNPQKLSGYELGLLTFILDALESRPASAAQLLAELMPKVNNSYDYKAALVRLQVASVLGVLALKKECTEVRNELRSGSNVRSISNFTVNAAVPDKSLQ